MDQSISLTAEERKSIDLSREIPGWGADLDPSVRPGIPRDKAPFLGAESLYPPITPQETDVRIHVSTEHGRCPPVFGTTCPPKGLSGWMRNQAYKLSEGRIGHWLTLILADRVDVIENLFLDLARGHVPNIFKEMGLGAELKYNRKNFQRKMIVTGVGVGAAAGLAYFMWSRRSKTRYQIK